MFQAVALIQEATTTHYLQLMKERVAEREARLRAFNRALTHEFRNRIGAALGAAQLLELSGITEVDRERLTGVVTRNIDSMHAVLENLLELSRLEIDTRRQRHVRLRQAAAEARRQLRDMARAHGVEIRIAADLPDIEVNAAAIELCLSNLVSNAIKYADQSKPERWVEVRGHLRLDEGGSPVEVVVEVRDNGLGVPEAQRRRLFERFFRAHSATEADMEGTGLGLSIVRETVKSLGGEVWAEFPREGSLFAFTAPCRRAADVSAVRAGNGGNGAT